MCRRFFLLVSTLLLCGCALAADFEVSCESPVVGLSIIGGELKYSCEVRNTGSTELELQFEVNDRNPIDESVMANFHPQPANLYIGVGETEKIVGFEAFPKIPAGQEEASYTRTFYVMPQGGTKDSASAKSAEIETIVRNKALAEDFSIRGVVTDARNGRAIPGAEITLMHDYFRKPAETRGDGRYSISAPALEYALMVEREGYGIYYGEVNGKSGLSEEIDVSLWPAYEKGEYRSSVERTLEAGAWEGVWRSAVSQNGEYIAFGTGGEQKTQGGQNAFVYLFDIEGNELWKKEMEGEVRGIDVSDNGEVAIGLGYGEGFDKARLYGRGGELIWGRFREGDSFQEIRISESGKYVAVGNTLAGKVYLLDKDGGSEIWEGFAEGQVRALKFYGNETGIIAGSGSGYIYMFGIGGELQWKAYVDSWPYGFIAVSEDLGKIVTGGHMSVLYSFDSAGNELWNYETTGGFRWAEIGEEGRVAGGTRSEFALLNKEGKILWKSHDSMSGMFSADGKHILTGDQGGHLEIRDLNGALIWEYPEGIEQAGFGRDVRFSYISRDNSRIAASTKTGKVYFLEGGISAIEPAEIPLGSGDETGEQPPPPNGEPPAQMPPGEKPPAQQPPPIGPEPPPVHSQPEQQENYFPLLAGAVIVIACAAAAILVARKRGAAG